MNKHNSTIHTILLLFSNLQAAHKLVVVKETHIEENTIGSPTCRLGLANYDPWAKSSLLPVQINKFYCNTATFTHLHIALTIFCTIAAELSCLDRDLLAHRAKNFYSLTLYRLQL